MVDNVHKASPWRSYTVEGVGVIVGKRLTSDTNVGWLCVRYPWPNVLYCLLTPQKGQWNMSVSEKCHVLGVWSQHVI